MPPPSQKNPLIKVRPRPGDYIQPDRTGGGPKKLFSEVDGAFRTGLNTQLESAIRSVSLRKVGNESAVLKVKLHEKALAKSHRPYRLFAQTSTKVIGTNKIGELLVSASQEGLLKLSQAILNDHTQIGAANLSTIQEISEYVPSDVLGAFGDDFLRTRIANGLCTFKIHLFNHRSEAANAEVSGTFIKAITDARVEYRAFSYNPNLNFYIVDLTSYDELRAISELISVKSIRPLPTYSVLRAQANTVRNGTEQDLPLPDPEIDYPIVGVIDSGVPEGHPRLSPWIAKSINRIPPGVPHDYTHGCFVGGLIANSRGLNHNDPRFPSCTSKILDVAALLNEGITEPALVALLEEVLEENPEVRVWNLSLGSDVEVLDEIFSDLAVALDDLQERFSVVFVVAAGNYEGMPLRTWPSQGSHLTDRIAFPADSARAITVGSVAHNSVANSLVLAEHPSPFSRRGPGPAFIPKPEVVHYGGNCTDTGSRNQTGVLSTLSDGNIGEDIGTSFSTPIVSSLLANILHRATEPMSINLAKALLIHSSILKKGVLAAEELKYFGFGVPPDLDEVLSTPDWAATSIFEVNLVRGMEFIREIPIPPALINADGKVFGDFTVTLVYDPPLDKDFPAEYCRSNVDVSLGTFDEADGHKKQIPLNPTDIDQLYEKNMVEHGFKWSPIKVYKRIISRGVEGTRWRLKMTVSHRGEFTTNNPQSAVVLVTIADPNKTRPVFREFSEVIQSVGWETSSIALQTPVRTRVRR